MYLLFRFEDPKQLQHVEDMGRFMEYVIGYVPADLEHVIDITKLDATVIPEAVAKSLPYLYLGWKGTVKLKIGCLADDFKLQRDIFSSLEQENEPDSVAVYTINETETANTILLGAAILRKKLDFFYTEKYKSLSLQADPLESATWEQQKREALEFAADSSAAVPMLDALATARGITTAAMVTLVTDAVSSYNTSMTTLLANKQTIEKEIKEIDTIGGFNKILHLRFGTSMSEKQMVFEGVTESATINL